MLHRLKRIPLVDRLGSRPFFGARSWRGAAGAQRQLRGRTGAGGACLERIFVFLFATDCCTTEAAHSTGTLLADPRAQPVLATSRLRRLRKLKAPRGRFQKAFEREAFSGNTWLRAGFVLQGWIFPLNKGFPGQNAVFDGRKRTPVPDARRAGRRLFRHRASARLQSLRGLGASGRRVRNEA
jgi:hypothetical protein